MARQAMDVVALDEVGPMDYRFVVRENEYRLRFKEGAWILDRFVRGVGSEAELVEAVAVDSLNEGINLALES